MLERFTTRASSLARNNGRNARVMRTTPQKLIKEPLEVFFRDLFERSANRDAGVVDEQVYTAMLVGHDVWKRRHCVAIGDVETVSRHANTVCPCQLCRACQAILVDIGNGEMTTAARQRHG